MAQNNAQTSIKSVIFAGGNISSFTLITSILSSWMWTTSIIGSVEAYGLYGIFGSIAYVGGAVIAFAVFVPLIAAVQRQISKESTYLSLIGEKYNNLIKYIYYLFAFCVSAYVLIEQAVGIAILVESALGFSFRLVSFFSVMLCVLFVVITGMKGVLQEEKFSFFVIVLCFLIMLVYFSGKGIWIYEEAPSRIAGQDNFLFISSVRYFCVATIIAFSQIFLDPAYYIKANMAKNIRQMYFAFSFSGIFLWGGISFVSSVVLGKVMTEGNDSLVTVFSGVGVALCLFAITIIGMSTICHYLMGMFGMFTVDFYRCQLKSEATEAECILFGKVMTIAIGIFCALIAISLEGISLLQIDMFCAVFFAAPCGPFLIAIKSKPLNGNIAAAAVAAGLLAGFFLWISGLLSSDWSWMAGAVASFVLPLVIISIYSLAKTLAKNKNRRHP